MLPRLFPNLLFLPPSFQHPTLLRLSFFSCCPPSTLLHHMSLNFCTSRSQAFFVASHPALCPARNVLCWFRPCTSDAVRACCVIICSTIRVHKDTNFLKSVQSVR